MESSELKILYEDRNFFGVFKPSGIHSAETPKGGGVSIASLLRKELPQCSHFGIKPEDAGLLNRLDFETSGILVVAKSAKARDLFSCETRANRVTKKYLSFVEGILTEPCTIDMPIGSRGRNSSRMRTFENPRKKDRAQDAVTHLKPIRIIKESNISLIEIEITQGRRHQIRVHLSSIGHPLYLDSLYGAVLPPGLIACSNQTYFFLHNSSISFVLEKSVAISAHSPSWISA